jgi:hypothetical protein
MRSAVALAICIITAGLSTAAATGAPYRIAQQATTAWGTIEIVEDTRLTPGLEHRLLHGCSNPLDVLDDGDPLAKSFARDPIRPARLRQVDTGRHVIVDLVLEKNAPVANIDAKRLGPGDDPVLVVGYNDNACMGSYSGQGKLLFRFNSGKLTPVLALTDDGRRQQVVMFSSLKSDWRFAHNTAGDIKIEQVFCRPDFEHETKGNLPFQMTYRTYRFQDGEWRLKERKEAGFWEADNGFPPSSKFP